jgi:thiol-disulfide isomerase/thioredoxin
MNRFRRIPSSPVFASLTVAVIATAAGPHVVDAQEATKTFIMHSSPRSIASISFADWQGRARALSDFKGKVVVLNIWATWCVPCRTEMPALDRLEQMLAGPDFEVVPVSIDRGGLDAVTKFYADIAVTHLAKYTDTSGQILRSLGAIGLPTTLIVDRAGNEVGRVVGPAEWDSPEVANLLRSVLAKPTNIAASGSMNAAPGQSHPNEPSLFWRGLQWLKALAK